MTKIFPKLFKQAKTGKIQEWLISVNGADITVCHGQVGGKIKEATETIHKGKNEGRSNETSPETQAENEAESKWTKQKGKGYVESLDDAINGHVDKTVITGGRECMLAHKYRDQADKILFPCYGQPKLDGVRCISIIEPSGRATLWTRRRKPINSVPHIVKELSKLASGTTLVLDGELYVGKYKNDFEKIISFVRQTTPAPGHEAIQYHVYDTVADKDFKDRTIIVSDLLKNLNHEIIVPVFTTVLNSKEELEENFSLFLEEGYEGLMARNALGWYDPGRSYNLQKVKEMQDAEYIISGVESGRGSREGQAVLICKTEEGLEFRASPKGKDAFRIRLLQEADKVIGKYATIQYQNLTSLGVPRFGVAKTVRDYE